MVVEPRELWLLKVSEGGVVFHFVAARELVGSA